MQHIYSNQLIAYLFEEIEPNTKENIERELATNAELRAELEELKSSLGLLKQCPPLSPSSESLQNILRASENNEAIPAG